MSSDTRTESLLWLRMTLAAVAAGLLAGALLAAPGPAEEVPRRPNVIYILADDLGYGELGCYGQAKIRTPRLDALARAGMRFTQHYSGSPVCAPSRCTLLTGLHTGHAFVRDNREMGGWGPDEPEGQIPLPSGTVTLARLLQDAGYATAAIGKWGLGGPGSTGAPNAQGFDLFYGYLCQRVAHNYYPTHLWRNDEQDLLEGNTWFSAHQKIASAPEDERGYDQYAGTVFAPDRMIDEALAWVRTHRDQPFFLYFATPVPHVALQVPDDSVEPYRDNWDETPYLGQMAYLPHPTPRAAYAAMITRMDRDIGRLLDLLDELDLADDTVVMFSSDNGPTWAGGADTAFFDSAGPLRGLKGSVYEGGIRVPFIVRWPGHVAPGSTSEHVSAFWDVLPTVCEITGIEPPAGLDGISLAPALKDRAAVQREHEYLYWEYSGHRAVRLGDWKAVRRRKGTSIELYDLADDLAESRDVAAEHADVVAQIEHIFRTGRTESADFPLQR
ncbi:MAG: arylsulfatase [Planctomycetota bacterium]